MIQVRIT